MGDGGGGGGGEGVVDAPCLAAHAILAQSLLLRVHGALVSGEAGIIYSPLERRGEPVVHSKHKRTCRLLRGRVLLV